MRTQARSDSAPDLLSALRALRAIDADDVPALAERLLSALVQSAGCARARLSHPALACPVVAQLAPLAADAQAATLRVEVPLGGNEVAASLDLERAMPFDDAAAHVAEVLAGELALRIAHAHARACAADATRQLDLVRALTHAGTEVLELAELADDVARRILKAFTGVHVALHVVHDNHLELIARRFPGGSRLDAAPPWLLRLPVDGPMVQALAVREKRIVARPIHELGALGRAALEPLGVRHLLVAPLIDGDTVVGVLSVAHRGEEPWNPPGMRILEEMTSRLTAALLRVRVVEDERRRARDLALLNDLGARVASSLDLTAVLTTAIEQLGRISGVSRVHVFLPDSTGQRLLSVACTMPGLDSLSFEIDGSSVAALSFRTGAAVIMNDVLNDPRTDKAIVARLGSRSIMCVPLSYQAESIGILALVETRFQKEFTKAEAERATAVANLLAPAIANAKMFHDLRESYDALGKAQAEAVKHERLAALGELSAVIAHEVRNPLGVIFNSVGSLRRIVPSTEDGELLLDIIEQEGARLNRIVGDLLDFVRPYASHPRPGRLDAVVTAAVEAARRAAPESTVRVRTEMALSADDVAFDETMLQQALLNLIVNAVQATPRAGEVIVRARTEERDGTLVFCSDVVDQGPGVDPDDGRIFEPFFTTKPTGTGLGLAIVRRIAAALGGSVQVSRGTPVGSVFSLIVPLAPA